MAASATTTASSSSSSPASPRSSSSASTTSASASSTKASGAWCWTRSNNHDGGCRGCCASKSGVFALTFLSYLMFHASRKAFSAIKGEMSAEEWIHSSWYSRDQQAQMYGLLDTLFMAFYAIGLYISGVLGDKYDLRKMIAFGMWMTALLVLAFGLAGYFGIHSLTFYATIWSLNGLIQSSGWPSNVAVMGKWFGASERGAILGLWSGNACLGNIVGTALVAVLFAYFDNRVAWKHSMTLVAVAVALVGLLIFVFLVPDPHNVPFRHEALEEAKREDATKATPTEVTKAPISPSTTSTDKESDLEASGSPSRCSSCLPASTGEHEGISFIDAWCIPGVIPYSLAFACLKAVNYALFFWLPFYLTIQLNMNNSSADFFSMLYDVGQILGGFIGGYASDKMGVRSPVVVLMMVLSCSTIYFMPGASKSLTGVLLILAGFMLGGPSSLMSTAISADLGTHESIRGNAEALSTVTGIIDGTGSIGAAFVQYLVGYLANCHQEPSGCDPKTDPNCIQVCSWGPVFVLLQVGTLSSCFCLLRLLYGELMMIKSRRFARLDKPEI